MSTHHHRIARIHIIFDMELNVLFFDRKSVIRWKKESECVEERQREKQREKKSRSSNKTNTTEMCAKAASQAENAVG